MLTKLKHGEIVKGVQRCDKADCNEYFKWVYQHHSNSFKKIGFYEYEKDEEMLIILDKDTLESRCYCNNCQRLNFFKARF